MKLNLRNVSRQFDAPLIHSYLSAAGRRLLVSLKSSHIVAEYYLRLDTMLAVLSADL